MVLHTIQNMAPILQFIIYRLKEEYEMNTETQKSWGWMIAVYIFSAGIGGGSFILAFIFKTWGYNNLIPDYIFLIAPILVLFGTLFLLFDLGSVRNAYRLFLTPSAIRKSWIARGA